MSFKLTEFEAQSALWQKIAAELDSRLTILRQKNDGEHDANATSRIRGEINAVKTMLEWAKPAPTINTTD